MPNSSEKSVREAVAIRSNLNSLCRHYVYNEDVKKSYEKKYVYSNIDVRLLQFAENSYGEVSDCYLLYAVAMMGVADLESIRGFLSSMSAKYPELSIPDMSEKDNIRSRLKALSRNGFLFKHTYQTTVTTSNGEQSVDNITLYSIDKDSQQFMSQKLGKRVVAQLWIQAKPLYELIGWASCGYVAGIVAQDPSFYEYKQGIFKTRTSGTVMMPPQIKYVIGQESVYVALIPAFFHWDKAMQTKDDYLETCADRINMIKSYIDFRTQREQNCRVICVVEDNADLMEITGLIHKSGVLNENYDILYFTGEGALRASQNKKTDCFVEIRDNAKTDNGYDIISAVPDFLA
jgi:hypothetical protein